MEEAIRVRVAPSPTGKFHFGSARVALFNYLYAKKFGGTFVLRIEDTDKKRSTKEFEQDIMNCMRWLGLEWDEGPEKDGMFGPYLQSERSEIYQKYLNQLLESGLAYNCYCTPEETTAERDEQTKRKESPKYSGRCRNLTPEKIETFKKEGRSPVVRFKVEDKKIGFDDLIKGYIEFDMSLVGDFAIANSEGPLFLLTNVVDDSLMKISHVLRGEDHLSNTPKQIALIEALNLFPSRYGHFPMILNIDKSKMSKRKNPTSISEDFKEKGFLPEAMINFMAFLGWSPGDDREFFTLDDLTSEFSLERVGKSPAIFDSTKLEYINAYYIRQMKLGDLADAVLPFLERDNAETAKYAKQHSDYFLQIIALIQQRLRRLDEITELTKYFFTNELDYDAALLVAKKSSKEVTLKALGAASEVLNKLDQPVLEDFERELVNVMNVLKITNNDLLWPIRVAITGEPASPNVFELMEVLGKDRYMKRIALAIVKLDKG